MMGGGARQQTQRVTWPQPLPQLIPKNQPCQSPCPHPVSGPKSPGPRGPESKFWPLLRPQILLLTTTISPGGMQVTPPPTQLGLGSTLQSAKTWVSRLHSLPSGRGGGVTKSKGSLPNPRVSGAGYCGNKPLPAKQKQGGRQGPRHGAQRGRHNQAEAGRARDSQDREPDALAGTGTVPAGRS